MTGAVDHRLHTIVTQRERLLRCRQLLGEQEIALGPALGSHHDFHGSALARTGIADIDALALQIVEAADTGIASRHHCEGLGMQGKHSAQIAEGNIDELERAGVVDRVVLQIRLCQPEVKAAATDVTQVERGSGRGLRPAPGTLDITVHQPADGAARRVVDTGRAAGADQYLIGAHHPRHACAGYGER